MTQPPDPLPSEPPSPDPQSPAHPPHPQHPSHGPHAPQHRAYYPPPPPAPTAEPVHYAGPASYERPKTSPMAITALVFGILGFCVPLIAPVLAIVFGAIAMSRTRDPRVGGRGLAIAGLTLGCVGFFFSFLSVSILLPSLNRARETANRVKCASHMRQIGQALLLYSNDARGPYPESLPVVLATQDVASDIFCCPSSNETPATGGTPQAQANNLTVGPHLSYVYVGKGVNNSAGADTVVLYEPLTNHDRDGMNVLFGDGHVEFIVKQRAEKMIAELKAGHNPPRREMLR